MYKLDQLYAEKEKKFAEICALLARELGLGDFAKLGAEDRHRVDLEAEQHLKEWDETTEFRTRANIRPITPLRRLLSRISKSANESSMKRRSRLVFGRKNEDLDVNVSLRSNCDAARPRYVRTTGFTRI